MSFEYVVFEKSQRRWWCRFLHSEINHCYYIKIEGGKAIAINKTFKNIEVFSITQLSDIIKKAKVVKVESKAGKPRLLCLNTCVSLTKSIIGINKPFILTPYQLYKFLGASDGK